MQVFKVGKQFLCSWILKDEDTRLDTKVECRPKLKLRTMQRKESVEVFLKLYEKSTIGYIESTSSWKRMLMFLLYSSTNLQLIYLGL